MECLDGSGSLAASIGLAVLFTITIPLSVYGTFKMHLKIRAKNDAFMTARHPLLSFSSLLMCCADLILIQPLHCSLFFWGGKSHLYIMYLTASLLSDVRFVLFGFFFLARIWLLYYDFNFEQECSRLLWKRKSLSSRSPIGRILPELDNFYLNHRDSLGSPKMVMIVTSILISVSLVLVEMLPLLISIDITINAKDYLTLHDSIRIPMFVVEGLLLLALFHKIQSINDKV